MRDSELECLPHWRYCSIPYGEKGPRTRGWETTPLTLAQVPQTNNIGLLTGPLSGGIMAVDFDGPWAWEYWQNNIGIDFTTINTIMWTSNKPGRCQMAFEVPKEAWELLPNRINISGPPIVGGKPDGLEFRWSNVQSVLPPSLHPDNAVNPDINYRWLARPSQTDLQEIPIELLEWIVRYRPPVKEVEIDLPPIDINQIKEEQFDHLVALLEQLRGFYGRPDHATWLRWAFAAASEVGPAAAAEVMNVVWPEEQRGEYKQLLKSWKQTRSPTLGTLERAVRDRTQVAKRIIKNNNEY